MIQEIDNPQNKERIAVVVVGYNRIGGLSRLLDSLNQAKYSLENVPLVISIDASGNSELYDFVNEYDWQHGNKFVNIQKERLGLKNHIFQCFALSKYFKGVILLEDDLMVSSYFYDYAAAALNKYGEDEKIAGIALYTNEYGGFDGLPLQFVNNGYDVFAWQECCTWGEILNERMWNNFKEWMENFDDDFSPIDMHERMKSWTRAWSKYMMAYMISQDKYFIFPHTSVSTNFNDAGGEHGGGDYSLVQVSLLQGHKSYNLGAFDSLEKYDCYGSNKSVAGWLNLNDLELTVDFYGTRHKYAGRYILSPFELPYKKIKGYGLNLRPWELNIKYQIDGKDIWLYDKENSSEIQAPKRKYPYNYMLYFFGRYQLNITIGFVTRLYWQRVKRKFGIR